MALIQRGPSLKKQIQLGVTLVVVIGATLAVLYFGFIKKPAPSGETFFESAFVPSASRVPSQSGVQGFQELSAEPLFERLKRFGVWPLSFKPKGRTEPFIVPQE